MSISKYKILSQAKDSFSQANYKNALEKFAMVLQSFPNSKEAYNCVILSEVAMSGEGGAEALFDYYEILKDEDIMNSITEYFSLKEKVKIKETNIVAQAGKHRVLAQRIAKYYISYQSGIKDKNTVTQMKKAVKLFEESHNMLMSNKTNTPEINRELNKINSTFCLLYTSI